MLPPLHDFSLPLEMLSLLYKNLYNQKGNLTSCMPKGMLPVSSAPSARMQRDENTQEQYLMKKSQSLVIMISAFTVSAACLGIGQLAARSKEKKQMALLRAAVRNAHTVASFMDRYNRLTDQEIPFQSLLRNVIQKESRRIVFEMKNIYRNNPEKKELMYKEFVSEITDAKNLIDRDPKTVRVTRAALYSVFLASGIEMPLHDSLFVQYCLDLSSVNLDGINNSDLTFYCALLLRRVGFSGVRLVIADEETQSKDVLAEKNTESYLLHCEQNLEEADSVFEKVLSAKSRFDARRAILVINSAASVESVNSAEENGIELWDRAKLTQLASSAE